MCGEVRRETLTDRHSTRARSSPRLRSYTLLFPARTVAARRQWLQHCREPIPACSRRDRSIADGWFQHASQRLQHWVVFVSRTGSRHLQHRRPLVARRNMRVVCHLLHQWSTSSASTVESCNTQLRGVHVVTTPSLHGPPPPPTCVGRSTPMCHGR